MVRFWSVRMLLVALVLGACPLMPGVRADEATHRSLVQRAGQELRAAERLYYAGDSGAARVARRAQLLLEQADQQRAGDAETALLGIQASVFAGDREGARLWMSRYVSRSPYRERDPHLHYARALVAFYLDNRAEAAITSLDHMRAVSAQTQTRARDLLLYAALMAQGSREARMKAFEKSLPRLQRAARVAMALGDRRKQIAARANSGIVLQLAGRNEDSEKVFSRLSQEDAGNALWLWYHAVSILNQKRYADAKVPLGRVIDLMDAGKAREDHLAVLRLAHLKMGICDRALAGETEEDAKRRTLLTASRKAMERFVELVPDSVAGRFRLGVVLFEDFGLPHEAMVQLERAHELDPVCEASLRYLIRIATQHGPRPERDPDAAAAARRAWTKKRAAWEQELDEHAQRWAKERERRRVQSPDGTDGCS